MLRSRASALITPAALIYLCPLTFLLFANSLSPLYSIRISISSCVNHFIESDKDKKEIIFGCCEKDYNDIMAKLNISGCSIKKIDHKFNEKAD